jgi:nicotinate-nucleotide pyrophosphorylase (carboxylating)
VHIQQLIDLALQEDIGQGDITTEATIPIEASGTAIIRSKQQLIVCGHTIASEVFKRLGATYTALVSEGTLVDPFTEIAQVQGPVRSLLTGERVALNFLMKLSGIATHTHTVVDGIATELRIVDTRKTTPLLRSLEREAVRIGGGRNHRYALYDGVMIKDNHIQACGSITTAINRAKDNVHHLLKIEVEVENLTELEEAIEAGADVVMLDNMSNEAMIECVEYANGRVILEASGNMNRERIIEIQKIGIDVVSMGGLIHQARWADISMKMKR